MPDIELRSRVAELERRERQREESMRLAQLVTLTFLAAIMARKVLARNG